MATFIQTNDVETGTPTIGAGAQIRNEQYGIDNRISGYIIENCSISKQRTYDTTMSQKNAIVSELDVDEVWDAQLTLIGGDGNELANIPGVTVGDCDFLYAGVKWKIRDVQFQGAYNDKKRYQVSMFRAKCFPEPTQA